MENSHHFFLSSSKISIGATSWVYGQMANRHEQGRFDRADFLAGGGVSAWVEGGRLTYSYCFCFGVSVCCYSVFVFGNGNEARLSRSVFNEF